MTINDELWYRVHWDDCPEFSANNAWSALWGLPRSTDGSQSECTACGGDGVDSIEGGTCGVCDGTGWVDCEPGYSCTASAAELVAYFGTHGITVNDDETVVVFSGHQASTGIDGEPLVVPDGAVIKTMTWREFVRSQTTA